MTENEIPWGPTGEVVYNRTYSRTKPNGKKETWPETVRRVVEGNLGLVYGKAETWSPEVRKEATALIGYMERMAILPAGRHLWASGVRGRQFLMNCWVAPWGEKLSEHFDFTFMRLMEGGGVGSNYSSRFLEPYGLPQRELKVHIVCDPSHPNYSDMVNAGLISTEFSHEWEGCFAVEDSREGWSAALVDLIDTYMTKDEVRHEDRVYDVSRVRFKGAPLRTFGGTASGPEPFARMMHRIAAVMNGAMRRFWSFDIDDVDCANFLIPTEAMEMDHAIAECVVSGGNRRSARMAMVHWDDPFISHFLRSKADPSMNWTTNISVEIDDRFITALNDSDHIDHGHAWAVHETVVTGMLTNGEPGYWNSSLSNDGEPNPVVCTNPCGEIALMEREPCNLGHINLDAFTEGMEPGVVNLDDLIMAHKLMTRFLIRATYGDVNDAGSRDVLDSNRRIGVGHLGVQAFLAKGGIRFSVAPQTSFTQVLDMLYSVVRNEAHDYAFQLRIPAPVKVTTVAPTGTVAKMPGTTEGIHPIYSRYFIRRVRFSMADPAQEETVRQAGLAGFHIEEDSYDPSGNTWIVEYPTKDRLVEQVEQRGLDPAIVESADEISLAAMLEFQAMYQAHWADNAVSFTANIPAEPHQQAAMLAGQPIPAPTPMRVAEVTEILAYMLPRLKGTTLMLDGSRPQAPYERITEAEYLAAAAKQVADGTDEECASGACPVR